MRLWWGGLFAAVLLCGLVAALPPAEAASRRAQPTKPLVPEAPEAPFPLGAPWTLTSVNGKPVGGDAPSFTLDDKLRATGFSGCNTYSMTLYPVHGQKLAAGSIAVTRKQCDKELMGLERAFLVALHGLPVWSTEGSDLVIKSPATLLRFRRGF